MIKINDNIFGNDKFPNNEVVFKEVELNETSNTILMQFEGNEDIANLLFAVRYIRKEVEMAKLFLVMPYIPYSRMDRKINNQIFSLEIFADIINSCNFDIVYVRDPHSDVSLEKIDRIRVCNHESYVYNIARDQNIDVIVFPDAGANDKYSKVFKLITKKYPIIHGKKTRDLNNRGKIIGYNLEGDLDKLSGANVLIVDDICSYGNTFMKVAECCKEYGAKEVMLFVTHLENAYYYGKIPCSDLISKVFTTNSIIRKVESLNPSEEMYDTTQKVTVCHEY